MGTGEDDRRPRVVVLLGHDQDPQQWRKRYAAGETLDETPYGYEYAQRWCDVVWATSHPESRLIRRVRGRIAAWLGYDLVHAWRNRRIISEADIVWTHTEREHLAVAALPMRRRPPVIAQSVWLWDRWSSFSPRRRNRLSRLLRRHAVEITLSPVNARISDEAVPGRRVAFVPFGTRVAVDASRPPSVAADAQRRWVLAPGNDVHRDWPLLRDVAVLLPDVSFRVATARPAARALDWPSNAEVGPGTVPELRRLYAECAAVAVPLRANAHASGITVCIEAMGAARPLVATDVGGLDAYLEGCAHLVSEGDAAAFAAAISRAVEEIAPSAGPDAVVDRGLTHEDYVLRLVRLTRALLDGTWDSAVTAVDRVPAP